MEKNKQQFKKNAVKAHVENNAPHKSCTALKCTSFKYTIRSMQFGTQLISMGGTAAFISDIGVTAASASFSFS